MPETATTDYLMGEGMRWFGPDDPVPLHFIRQAGAKEIFTSLHQIPYGEPWPRNAIGERKALIESAGLRWTAVESVPIHEGIKTGRGDLKSLFKNYSHSLWSLAIEGIHTVIYNFMFCLHEFLALLNTSLFPIHNNILI